VVVRMTRHNPPTSRIARNPLILDGEPVVKGTRVPVRAIVLAHRIYPELERLVIPFPSLVPKDIREALSFYQSNQDEINRYIAENASQ
jgi:uncharacterized protein (DUF433 family)